MQLNTAEKFCESSRHDSIIIFLNSIKFLAVQKWKNDSFDMFGKLVKY